MYRLEVFDQTLTFVDAAIIPDDTEIVEDYVTLEEYTINAPRVMQGVKSGDVFRILEDGETFASGVIKGVSVDRYTTTLNCCCMLSLLDFETANPNHNTTTWQDGYDGGPINILSTGNFISGALANLFAEMDVAQYAFIIEGLYNSSVVKFNGAASANVFEVWKAARPQEKLFYDYINSGLKFLPNAGIAILSHSVTDETPLYIDADAPNVLERNIDVNTTNGAANVAVIHLYTSADSEITAVENRIYYRHTDGTVDMDSTGVERPLIFTYIDIQRDSRKTAAENRAMCLERAKEALAAEADKNEITLTYRFNDTLVPFDTFQRACDVVIMNGGTAYTTMFTGWRRTGQTITYYFGNARTDLTAKLLIERRAK